MGFNTTINILNDGLDQLRKHPEEFVESIMEKYNDGGTVGVGNHVNMVEVMQSRHADEFCLYVVHHNSIVRLNPFDQRTKRINERVPSVIEGLVRGAEFEIESMKRHLT